MRAHNIVYRTPKAETVVQCISASMSQEDIIFSRVFIYDYVVSLITKLFCELKPLSLYASVDLSYFQSGGQLCATNKTLK